MTTWYANLALTFDGTHSRSGQMDLQAWGGPAGAARAIASASPGDTILLANAADPATNRPLTALWKIPVASTTAMDAGDLLTDQTSGGVARIAVVVAGDYVLVEPIEGAPFAAGDTVTPDGGATTTTVDAPPTQPGLTILGAFAAAGTAAAPITLRGAAADWTTPQAAWLDGASLCDCLTVDALSWWRFDNLQLHRGAAYGFNCVGTESGEGCVLTRVTADLAGVHAFNRMHIMNHALMLDCAGLDATLEGMRYSPRCAAMIGCRMTGNGSYGIFHASELTCYACVLAANGGPGIEADANTSVLVLHCILDGNAVGAYAPVPLPMFAMIANRLTNNEEYGASATGAGVWSDYNVYFGNALGPSLNVVHGDNDHGPAGSGLPHEDVTADGYTSRPGGDYSLTADAAGRRMPMAVGATTAHLTAGCAPDDPPVYDHEVSFHDYEVTFA